MRYSFLLGLLAVLAPLRSKAQTNPTSSRFYVGLGVNVGYYSPRNVPQRDKQLAPALTAGLQLSSRLALQARLTYHRRQEEWYREYDQLPIGQPGPWGTGRIHTITEDRHRERLFTTPVLLRYSLLSPPASPVHVDALLGLTLLNSRVRNESTKREAGVITQDYQHTFDVFQAALTLGGGVRYPLAQRLEVVGEVLATIGPSSASVVNLNAGVGLHVLLGHVQGLD